MQPRFRKIEVQPSGKIGRKLPGMAADLIQGNRLALFLGLFSVMLVESSDGFYAAEKILK